MLFKNQKYSLLFPLLVIILSLIAIFFLGRQIVVAWPTNWGGSKTTGYPIDNTETRDVYDANDNCHKVTNNSGKNIFVPTKTQAEWNAFEANTPSGVTIDSCCTSHASYSCYNNDVYWYDSCGNREDKKEECGTSGYTGSNYCYDNDVYRDYVTRGCSGNSCYANTTRTKQEECGAAGCSGGSCVTTGVWKIGGVNQTVPGGAPFCQDLAGQSCSPIGTSINCGVLGCPTPGSICQGHAFCAQQ